MRVLGGEHFGVERTGDRVGDLFLRGPDVLEEYVVAIRILPQRIFAEIDVGRAGDGVGDDQRRAGEVVRFYLGADAAFEVAVARQHRGRDQVVRSLIAFEISGSSGPLLPMQVVQP